MSKQIVGENVETSGGKGDNLQIVIEKQWQAVIFFGGGFYLFAVFRKNNLENCVNQCKLCFFNQISWSQNTGKENWWEDGLNICKKLGSSFLSWEVGGKGTRRSS
jgi:hypothetical protein